MHVTLLVAQSLDGFITRHDTPGTDFTSPADKKHFSTALQSYDASVMGAETYRVSRSFIRSRLSGERHRVVITRNPAAFSADAVPGQLEFSAESPAEIVSRLTKQGRRACALLGGSQIHRLFLNAGLVDTLVMTIEPRIFGKGTPLLDDRADVSLSLRNQERLPGSDSLLLTYDVIR